jgi:cyclopropane-fatty-acyl-phospholipid synthase
MQLSDMERQTKQHYDLDPRIFALILDRTLKYSPGIYRQETDTLDQAQAEKLEFIAEQLGLRGGERVLDIGCGWGSLVCFLAEQYCCQVLGVTPSPPQAAYIRQRAAELDVAEQVALQVAPFQETTLPARSFDAIALVGSMNHIADSRGVLAECYRLSRPRGRLYLSSTCFRNREKQREFYARPATAFVREAIFGWGEAVPASELIEGLEDAGFSLVGLTDLTAHYARTVADWRRNAERNRAALEVLQPGLVDRFLTYFDIANAGWGYTMKHYAVVAARQR